MAESGDAVRGSGAAWLAGWLPPLDDATCERQPPGVVSALKRAHALSTAGRSEEALTLLDSPLDGGTAAELATGDLKRAAFGLRGEALYKAERFSEAAATLKVALEADGSEETAHLYDYGLSGLLAFALIQLGRYDEAVAAFSRAIAAAWTPTPGGKLALAQPAGALAEVYGGRGFALGCLDRSDEAIEDCRRAIEIDPAREDRLTHEVLAGLLTDQRRYDEALEVCDVALARPNPRMAELHKLRGRALGGLRRWEEALASVERAIAFDPGIRAVVYASRGDVLWNLGRQAEAIAAYTEALARCVTPEEYAVVSGSLSTIAKYLLAVTQEFGIKLKEVGESKAADYTGGIMSDAAEFHAVADDALKSGVPLAEFRDAIKKLTAKAETTAHGPAARAAESPRPETAPAPLAWPSEKWKGSPEELSRKQHAIVGFLRRVWVPFIDGNNLLVTRGMLAEHDEDAAAAVKNYVRNNPLPPDIRLPRGRDLRKVAAGRPLLTADVAAWLPCGNSNLIS